MTCPDCNAVLSHIRQIVEEVTPEPTSLMACPQCPITHKKIGLFMVTPLMDLQPMTGREFRRLTRDGQRLMTDWMVQMVCASLQQQGKLTNRKGNSR